MQHLLDGSGAINPHLPATISVLDEILTDFIIETCHYAALSASYSRRQKIKADDFKFVLRKDEMLLGKVQETLWREKKLKEDRKMGDMTAQGSVKEAVELAGIDEKDTGKKAKRKKRKAGDDGERPVKRRDS